MKCVLSAVLSVIIMLSSAIMLSSCADKWNSLMGSLGFDTRDYESESVTASYPIDSPEAAELSEYVRMLFMTVPSIPDFHSSSEAITLFRDSLLNYMLSNNYSRYTGDLRLLDEASEKYPSMQVTNLIPAKEFEQTYYTYFGGAAKITNKNAEYFMYLAKLDAYTSLSEPVTNNIEVNVISLDETENTYRLSVSLSLLENVSPEYNIIFIKREDKTVYFRSLESKK